MLYIVLPTCGHNCFGCLLRPTTLSTLGRRLRTGLHIVPLVLIVGVASSACLCLCTPFRSRSAHCCCTNENISKSRVAAVACQVYVCVCLCMRVCVCVLFIVWCLRVTGRPELLTPNVTPINNLWNDAVSNGIPPFLYAVRHFSPNLSSHLPSRLLLLVASTSLFISPLFSPSFLVQFISLISSCGGKKKRRRGKGSYSACMWGEGGWVGDAICIVPTSS